MDAWRKIKIASSWCQPAIATAIAAFLLLTLWLSWISVSGTSALAAAAWCLAVTAGAWGISYVRNAHKSRRAVVLAAAVIAALMTFVSSSAFDASLQFSASSGLPMPLIWFMAAAPATIGGAVAYLLAGSGSNTSAGRQLVGIAISAILFLGHVWLPMPFGATTSLLTLILAHGLIPRVPSHRIEEPQRSASFASILVVGLNLTAGIGLVAGALLFNRLFAVTPVVVAAGILSTGVILGLSYMPLLRLRQHPWRVWAFSLAALALAPWYFQTAPDWNLQLRATAESSAGLVVFQALQLALIWAPLLLATWSGGCLVNRPQNIICPVSLTTGIATAWMLTAFAVSPTWILAGSACLVGAIPALYLWTVPAVTQRFRILRTAGVTLSLLLTTSLTVNAPDLTAASLQTFDARSIIAFRRGVTPDMIPETDAARLVDSRETADGTLTIWKPQANRLDYRINGHLIGEVSTDTTITPQPPAEVVTCILPLVLHPNAGKALILNDYSGVAEGTCEQFPLHQVIIARTAGGRAGDQQQPSTLQHFTSINSTPEIAVRNTQLPSVDVIISMLADPNRSAALSQLSESWFQAVSQRLTKDGVFCQRIRQAQLGNEMLLQILGNASAAFAQVAVVQLPSNECALVATNSAVPVPGPGTLARLERQHVRQHLSHCGWDWCQIAALPVAASSDPVGLWSHHPMPAPTTSGYGIPTLRLGWDAAHSTQRIGQVQRLLAPHHRRIAEAVPHGKSHEEFRRRISAYAQQVEVLTAFPDEPWIYRKSLKSEMQRNQRPPLEVVKDGELKKQIHPLDQYRKDYLNTLG